MSLNDANNAFDGQDLNAIDDDTIDNEPISLIKDLLDAMELCPGLEKVGGPIQQTRCPTRWWPKHEALGFRVL